MSRLERIKDVVVGLLMLLGGLILFLFPDNGCYIIAAILAISLFLAGIRQLYYYFTMARHMVGGLAMLLIGVFLLDFAAFTATIIDESRLMVLLYLVGWYGFAGLVSLLRALEARRLKASSWKLKAATGAINILSALGCFLLLGQQEYLVILYSLGLIYTAAVKIISAFRKTASVYIQ